MSKTKSYTVGASIKQALLNARLIAIAAKEIAKAKAEQAKNAAMQSKAEFVKGYNSVK